MALFIRDEHDPATDASCRTQKESQSQPRITLSSDRNKRKNCCFIASKFDAAQTHSDYQILLSRRQLQVKESFLCICDTEKSACVMQRRASTCCKLFCLAPLSVEGNLAQSLEVVLLGDSSSLTVIREDGCWFVNWMLSLPLCSKALDTLSCLGFSSVLNSKPSSV